MTSSSSEIFKQAWRLKQPEMSCLVRELRQLMQLTQSQLAVELGVAHETIDGWEKGRIRPSQLALRQICSVLYQLRQSSSTTLRNGSAALFKKYLNQSSSPSGRIGESAKSNPLSD